MFRKSRRRKLLASPFPDSWTDFLLKNAGFYSLLSDSGQESLRNVLRILIAEKNWEGCGGLGMTEEIQVTIAAQAALLLLGRMHDYYPNVRSILVYPTHYRAPGKSIGPDGVVSEGVDHRDGEAWHNGSVVLGWDAVVSGGRNSQDGRNVVFHEFAHQLDFADGLTEGIPFHGGSDTRPAWRKTIDGEFKRLIRDLEMGARTLLDPYGAESPAEFFAVATECFFEQAVLMRSQLPLLYDALKDYYGQDPAERVVLKEDQPQSTQRTQRKDKLENISRDIE